MSRKFQRAITALLLLGVVRGVIALVELGSEKRPDVREWGADENLGVVYVTASYVSEADATAVTVGFTGTAVTVSTPVSVRNWETNPWTELTKINPTVTTDFPTNTLSFSCSGNETGRNHWWVGVDTPAVIIETTGITIVQFEARSHYVLVSWICDDPRATEFEIQYRERGETSWHTIGVTSETQYIHYGFTLDRNSQWRVLSTIGGL